VDFALSYGPSDDPEEAVKFVLRIVSAIRDPIRVSLDLKRLSDGCGISEVALQKSLESVSRDKRSAPPRGEEPRKVEPIACDKIEKSIISMVIGIPQCADRVFEEISPTDFADQRVQRIAEVILDRKSKGLAFDVSALVSAIEDEPTRQLLIESSVTGDFGGDEEKAVSDHISCMKRRAIGREIESLRRQIKMAEKAGDAELLQSLLSRRQSLAQDLKLLST
jgi:hypothetical protein